MNKKTASVIGTLVVIAVIVVGFFIILGNSITMSEFNKIEVGMSYEEVVEIIGCEGELSSQASFGGYSSALYTWKGVLYHLNGANAVISFSNGEVSALSCIGLIF